jgi:hypothetical protein
MTLGQDLEGVLAGNSHHLEDPRDVVVGDALVEQVAHRVDEDHPWSLPTQRMLKPIRPQLEREALLIGMTRHPNKTLCERLRIAMRASR